MDTFLLKSKEELNKLTELKNAQEKELSRLEGFDNLILVSAADRNGHVYYYAKERGNSPRKYLGSDSNETVIKIREARYLKNSIAAIDNNISLISKILTEYKSTDFHSISNALPKVYQGLQTLPSAPHPPQVNAWLEDKLKYKAKFEIKHPENLKIRAADGTMVRSKSEAIISNLLSSNHVPYIYELPHVIDGVVHYADFTTLSLVDFISELIIEHQGMMGDARYDGVFLSKLHAYRKAKYTPGLNLFFTFDDPDGGIDTYAIQKIIDCYIKK